MFKYLRFSNNKIAFVGLYSSIVISTISLLFNWDRVLVELYVFCAGLLIVSVLLFFIVHIYRAIQYKAFSKWRHEIRYKWYFHFYVSSKNRRGSWRYIVRDNIVENNIYHQLDMLGRKKELSGFKKILKFKINHFNIRKNANDQERFDQVLYCTALDTLTDLIHAVKYSEDSELLINISKKTGKKIRCSSASDAGNIVKANKKMTESIELYSQRFSDIVNAYMHLTQSGKLDMKFEANNADEFKQKLLDVKSMISKN